MDDSHYTLFNLTTRLIFSVPISNDIMSELCRCSHGKKYVALPFPIPYSPISYVVTTHILSHSVIQHKRCICSSIVHSHEVMFFTLPCVGRENAWDVTLPDVLFRSILPDVLTSEYNKFTHCI